MSPVPVDREQDAAENYGVVGVEPGADGLDQLVRGAVGVRVVPGRHLAPGAVQVSGPVLAEPHRAALAARPQLTLDITARFMVDASLTIGVKCDRSRFAGTSGSQPLTCGRA
jgi:hypothetical protein